MMRTKSTSFSLLYQRALRKHLNQTQKIDCSSASGLGAKGLVAGLETLDLAILHEKTLVVDLLPSYPAARRNGIIKRAAAFFAAAISPDLPDETLRGALGLKRVIEALSDRMVQLATANQLLGQEVAHRKEVECSLMKSEKQNLKSLERSNHLREQLRTMSHQMLTTQEQERKKISRELHDVIAQELMGIHVQLATLKAVAGLKAKGLNRDITLTQRKVIKSAEIIHQFARELRPTALDDLGLIPALHSLLKVFSKRTNIRTKLTSFAGVDRLNVPGRTVLYRVAQEAFCNIERHANAGHAQLTIRRQGQQIQMEVKDNGCSFDVEAAMHGHRNKHLGLLGMRERVEMIGGTFQVNSAAGKGTTVIARIPVAKATLKQWDLQALKDKKEKS